MNCNRQLNLIKSKFRIQLHTILIYFGIALTFTACNKKNDSNIPEKFPSLKIVNSVSDDKRIFAVNLVAYDFNSLNISSGNSQTFTLESGMPGGYDNINVTISLRNSANIPIGSLSKAVNFKKGEITTITLKGCNSYEGCAGLVIE
jgi:hypothetical protein